MRLTVPPYQLMYKVGFAPWERRDLDQTWTRILDALGNPPPGRALDIGCGSGRDAVYLAKRGWQVTGLDFAPEGLEKAKQRAAEQGANIEWVQGDVGKLGQLGLEPGYSLIYDFGCIQGLPDDARHGAAAGIGQLAAPQAALLVFAFSSARRLLLPRGMDQPEIVSLFGGAWDLEHSQPMPTDDLPRALRSAKPTLYRLNRRGVAE
jgi:SAM-dependent methyltransferase